MPKIHNIDRIKDEQLSRDEIELVKFLIETDETAPKELVKIFKTNRMNIWAKMKKIQNKGAYKIGYKWDFRGFNYAEKIICAIKGKAENILKTGIIMEIEYFEKQDISLITAYIKDSFEENIIRLALEKENKLFYVDKLL